ncbi:MAG: DNA polymerase IV [Caldicoprobacterales bacterium]|jgi:DNA polymerase-4|nr:DNA polymerase IV [Clostridiales bacterium]
METKNRIIFHIDVNSAYLSWEAVYRLQHGDTLDLRTIPSVVGGDVTARRGIVLAKSIPTKPYKIKTGESLFSAKLKCPDLVIVPPRYHLYMQCSKALISILEEYSPSIQQFSIDEVFLDFTNMEVHWGDPIQAAHRIKERIKKELGFTVNIGISNNKLLAKMASDLQKPDKVHTLFPHEIGDKMWPLPVEELFMVGRSTTFKLHKKGIFTIGDLAATDPKLLMQWFKSHGRLIWEFANGIENSPVRQDFPVKGLGNSSTIAFDIEDRKTAHRALLSLTETVAMRLRDIRKSARVLSVYIKDRDFESCSHQRKLDVPTNSTNILYQVACQLFDELWQGQPLRHLGVRTTELYSDDFYQLSFLEADIERQKALDAAVDQIRNQYGWDSIVRSCFLYSRLSPMMGGVIQEEEYPMMSSML